MVNDLPNLIQIITDNILTVVQMTKDVNIASLLGLPVLNISLFDGLISLAFINEVFAIFKGSGIEGVKVWEDDDDD